MSESRRKEEKVEITAEGRLAGELGSDSTVAAQGKSDMRRFSKLNRLDVVWNSHFMLVPDEEGGEYAKQFCDNFQNLAVSEEGWRTNKVIQLVAGSKGAPSVGELMKKPNILQRNITDRKWRKRAEEEGKTIVH